jgi:hypothetical protein
MKEIVVNRCYGGFGLSEEAKQRYEELTGGTFELKNELIRDDPVLVRVVKELGKNANTDYSELEVIEIPDDVQWEIGEYDGLEWVAEKHRVWYGKDAL